MLCFRRLIRRAGASRQKTGNRSSFHADLARTVAETSKTVPELDEKFSFIHDVIASEEAAFGKTIDQGLRILSEREEEMLRNDETVLDGEKAFELSDTYGFPLDLTRDILSEKGYTVDEEGFEKARNEQKKRAHDARKTSNTWVTRSLYRYGR
jgi:alanyl-tRNA synthetase